METQSGVEKRIINMLETIQFVAINDDSQPQDSRNILKQKAKPVTFPLSSEDTKIVKVLEEAFDAIDNCAGIAAPQLGYSKQMIIFAAPDDIELKKWRANLTQTMDKTIWLNPKYEGVGDEMEEDFEACFSVIGLAGMVERFAKIKYEAVLPTGESITGEAEGFLARVIQHEIDHLNGILFLDRAIEGTVCSLEEYKKIRAEKMEAQ
jgi:peptide deformylase